MSKDITKAPERPSWATKLDDREMLFVAAYLDCLNAAEAARIAGYAKSGAAVQGFKLRRKPHVADAITAALAERMGVTRARIVEEVSRLAFSNIGDVLTIENGEVIVKDHAKLNRDTLSTIAEVREVANDKGYRTIHIRQHDRLQALTLLARISGMLINRQEISGPGGGPVEIDHTVDHSARIRSRLDEIARRLPVRTEPIIDVTPQKGSPSAMLGARLNAVGKRD
jgi:phage terminase small subunit